MADVLLTHSYHLPFDAKQLRKMQPYAPIGTLYAASALRQRGFSVAIFDSMLEEPGARFKAMLREKHIPFADYGVWAMGGWYQIFLQDPDGTIIEVHQADYKPRM